MAKGAKKRRATKKQQEKALQDTQPSCPSAKVESCRLEENEEDVFRPKTPVQANEGEDKDRMFDMVGGSASPSSHTEEVVISDGVEYKSGSFDNAGFQEFSASGGDEVGNIESLENVSERNGPAPVPSKSAGLIPPGKLRDWDVLRNIDDITSCGSLELSTKEGDGGNAVSFDQCDGGLMEATKQSELEIGDTNNNIMEHMHNEYETIQDMVIYDCSLSLTDDVTTSQKFMDTSEGFSLIPSGGLESFNSCVEREPAMSDEDGMNWLSEQQNGHGKDIIKHNSELGTFDGNSLKDEIGYKDRGLLEEVNYEKRSIEQSESHDISLCQVGAHTFSESLVSHKFVVSKADDPKPSERIATAAEKIESTTIFDEGYSMSVFQGVLRSSSPRKLECTILGGEEGLELAQGHSEHVKDISLDIHGQDDAVTRKQLKDECWDFYRLTRSTNESIEKLETHESNAYQAHNISLPERLETGASDQGGLETLQEHNGCEKKTNLDNSESRKFEMLHGVDNYKSDDVAASQTLQNAIKVNSFPCNSCTGFCMISSQALFDTKNPEQMGSTIAVELDDPQLLHAECKDEQDLCLVSSEHVCVEVNNQPKDANVRNDNTQGAAINMLKEEFPVFEDFVVSLPAAEIEPSVDTSHPLVPADLDSNNSSGGVLLDNEVTLKGKSNDDNGSSFRDTSEEHAQKTEFLKLNGEEKDIHLEKAFPGELDGEAEETDMFLQSKEKLGRKLGFCGVLEFLLCWRD
ncbi:hypothetical protein SUGI_0258220 [Cryptomeria japonica]|uniref:uncharacterized protein LOC131044733 n=1 Tax=Cryptomeria japonica TaxID=3369 RepID=UPI002408EDD4|nr:uncharacterized protein LOC131044733 [Cryptomeria japonica]GLJ15692.1 hypothetical protein SUGI_0258220 [Cryptomeria japonica]